MPAWSIWLTDHNGVRLADLSKNQGFEFARTANSVGSFRIKMEQDFDDTLLAKDYRVEIWREFAGESVLVFAGMADRWKGEGTRRSGGRRLHVDGKCMNHLLDKRVVIPEVSGDWGPSYVFAGTYTDDTFQISDDNGATWTITGTPGMTTFGVTDSCLAADGSLIVTSGSSTGGEVGKIHRSDDGGNTWMLVHSEAAGERYVYSVCRVPSTDTLIATTGNSGKMLRSTDHGITWAAQHDTGGNNLFSSVVAANDDILVGTQVGFFVDPDVWRSQDDGVTWSNIFTLTWPGGNPYQIKAMYKLRNGDLLIGTGPSRSQIWRSQNDGASWSMMVDLQYATSSDYIFDFTQLPSGLILAGTRQGARIFGSYGGRSWWPIVDLAAGGFAVKCFMLLNNGEALAGTDISGKIYQSTNQGTSWSELSDTGQDVVETLSRTAL